MGLLIKNGDFVTSDSRFRGDVYAENETITRIGASLDAPPGTEVLDAAGRPVFPGFIDPHVHIYLPFMATFAKDTHETGSRAALIGGTTTFIEMCCPSRNDDALAGYQLWKSKAEGHTGPPRRNTCPASCALRSFWHWWSPAAPGRVRSKAATPTASTRTP